MYMSCVSCCNVMIRPDVDRMPRDEARPERAIRIPMLHDEACSINNGVRFRCGAALSKSNYRIC